MRAFLSYAYRPEVSKFAKELQEFIEKHHFEVVDGRWLNAAEDLGNEIKGKILECDVLVAIVFANTDSRWVDQEIGIAIGGDRPVILIVDDDSLRRGPNSAKYHLSRSEGDLALCTHLAHTLNEIRQRAGGGSGLGISRNAPLDELDSKNWHEEAPGTETGLDCTVDQPNRAHDNQLPRTEPRREKAVQEWESDGENLMFHVSLRSTGAYSGEFNLTFDDFAKQIALPYLKLEILRSLDGANPLISDKVAGAMMERLTEISDTPARDPSADLYTSRRAYLAAADPVRVFPSLETLQLSDRGYDWLPPTCGEAHASDYG